MAVLDNRYPFDRFGQRVSPGPRGVADVGASFSAPHSTKMGKAAWQLNRRCVMGCEKKELDAVGHAVRAAAARRTPSRGALPVEPSAPPSC